MEGPILLVSGETGRCFVASRDLKKGELLLDEEPCYFFQGNLDARSMEKAVTAFDKGTRPVVLDHFTGGANEWWQSVESYNDERSPLPEEATFISSLVKAALVYEKSVDIIRLVLILARNSHPCGGGGVGLFRLGAIFNHSCRNNVRTRPGTGRHRIWYAGEDIAKGTELTASYIDQCHPVLLMDTERRRQYLMATKLFHCVCDRCQDPLSLESCLPCPQCRVQLLPSEVAAPHCQVCDSQHSEDSLLILRRGLQRLFGLLCGDKKLASLSDNQCTELLSQTVSLYGERHWTCLALSLALLSSRVSLSKSLAPYVTLILSCSEKGARRVSRVVVDCIHHALENATKHESRRDAIAILAQLFNVLRRCIEEEAFASASEMSDAQALLITVQKTLFYAADPSNRPACCTACALAQFQGSDMMTIAEEQQEWGDGTSDNHDQECCCQGQVASDYEICEEYSDIEL